MTNPRLLILDEATEGLAPLVVAEIWRVVAGIRATGIATLIVDRNYRQVLAPHRPRRGDGKGPASCGRRVGGAGAGWWALAAVSGRVMTGTRMAS